MTIICAVLYDGRYKTDDNLIIMAYNCKHLESLETISPEHDKRAIELVESKKSNGYRLDKTHIALMSRISQNNPAPATKGPANKAKVNQREYKNLKHRFKCHGCNWSYDYDQTKICREIRDKKRQENDKKT